MTPVLCPDPEERNPEHAQDPQDTGAGIPAPDPEICEEAVAEVARPPVSQGVPWRRRIAHIVWSLRFVYVQAAILAAVAWVLLPLRDATALPFPPLPAYTPEPPDLQQTMVLAPETLVPGTQAAVRVIVYDPRSGQPIPGAEIRVALGPPDRLEASQPLFAGQADDQGTATVVLSVPDEPACGAATAARSERALFDPVDCALVVETAGRVGTQRIMRPVTLQRTAALDLITDQELYQPGDTIHARAQAVDALRALPVPGQPITLTFTDPRGSVIRTQVMTTTAYGAAFADCELASRANLGTYRVRAAMGGVSSERTVEVEPHAIAPFRVDIETGQPYYVVGEGGDRRIEGTVHATYPWGGPVASAQVQVSLSALEREAQAPVQVEGRTNDEGLFSFELDLPGSLAPAAQAGLTALRLSAEVTDEQGRAATSQIQVPAAAQPILVRLAPEEGTSGSRPLKLGIENLLYLSAAYPDGQPAQCTLTVEAPGLEELAEVRTGADGYASWRYRPVGSQPVTLIVTAQDDQGREGVARLEVPVEPGDHHVLLTPQQRLYQGGEVMHVEARVSPAAPAVYLDVLRGGQPVAAYSAPVTNGSASFDLDLAAGLAGTLELRGYVLLQDGSLVRDTRWVRVEPAGGIRVSLRADRERYAPGDVARVSVNVADAQGSGVPGGLSVAVIADAADGGHAAEGTLPLQAGDDLARPANHETELIPLYGEQVSKPRPMPDQVRRQFDAVASARGLRRQTFTGLSGQAAWGLGIAAALLWIVALVEAWRGRTVKPTLRAVAGRVVGGVLVLPFLLGGTALLAYLGGTLFGPGAAIVLGMGWLGALLGLLVYAWGRPDGWGQVLLALLAGYLALGGGLGYALAQGGELPAPWAIAGPASFACALLALYAFGTGLMRRREQGGTLSVLALLILLPLTFAGTALMGAPGHAAPAAETVSSFLARMAADAALVDREQTLKVVRAAATPTPTPLALATPTLPAAQQAGLPLLPVGSAPSRDVYRSQGFPQTIFWRPDAVADAQGSLSLEIPLSAGTRAWDLAVIATTGQGMTAVAQERLQAFKPLSVKADLPAVLTVGDALDVPLTVYNALPVSQTVTVTVTQPGWFTLRARGMDMQQIELPAASAGTLHLPIRVTGWGAQALDVSARSDRASDAASLRVDVVPDGLPVRQVYSGQVEKVDTGDEEDADVAGVQFKFRVPWSAIQGTDRVTVRFYPDWSTVLAEGIAGALGTSGPAQGASLDQFAAWTRVRVLSEAYLRGGQQPAAEDPPAAEIERALGLAYQQLLTYETARGGFSAFGQAPADIYHSAEALMSLNAIARLYPVDRALVERTSMAVFQQQSLEGTWVAGRLPPSWNDMPHAELPFTAYAAWALIEAGYADTLEVRTAIEYLEHDLDQAQDPYVLALALHALLSDRDRSGSPGSTALDPALARLAEMAEVEDGMATWRGDLETFSGAVGSESADVERTALAVLALLRARVYPEVAAQGLAALADARDASGTWGSPQATLWALQAFWAAVQEGEPARDPSQVSATVNEISAGPVTLVPGESDQPETLVFDELAKGYNGVALWLHEGPPATYQVLGAYYLPWEQVSPSAPESEKLSVEVGYDRTSIEVGETITVAVGVTLNRPGTARLAVVELGLPPGLEPVPEDWESLVKQGAIAYYERTGGQIRVYLPDLAAEQPVHFQYRLRSTFPLSVKTLLTRAYDLANPQRPAVRQPVRIEVMAPGE
jgi:hypothetical protein